MSRKTYHSPDSIEIIQDKLTSKIDLLNHIYEISTLLTQSPDINEVLNEIVDRVTDGLNYDRAIVMLLNEKETKLECKSIKGFSPIGEKRAWTKPLVMDIHDCYETKVIKSGKPLFIPDIWTDPYLTEIDKIIGKYQERKSFLHVPLRINEKVIGTIGVDRYKTRMEITKDDVEALTIFANQAAIVIQNARLYKALEEEKAISENIIKSSVNGVIFSDLSGKILNVNPRAMEILGIPYDDAKKTNVQSIFNFDQKESQRIYKLLKRKKPFQLFDREYIKKDGEKRILNLACFAVNIAENNRLGAVTLITDLTEKRKMDDYLHRIEKFAALGRIVSSIAHEIRNPLAGIYATTQNLIEEIDNNNYKTAKSDLENILQEIDRVEKLMRDSLNLAKPLPLQIEEVDIHQLILTTIHLIKKESENRGVQIKTEFEHEIEYIKADPNRLKQVFLNLMINALEAVQNDGKIVISTTKENNRSGKNKWIVIKFKDNGVGIGKNNIHKIFDPFFTSKSVGTGLGLTVSHKIIEDHKGLIEVESEENKGSTFYVKLSAS